jgi:hypothetical protein
MAGTVNLQTEPVGRVWPMVQFSALVAGIGLICALLAVPRTGLHLLWDVAVPLLPLLLLIAPGVWRNACPLATFSLLPARTGLSRRRSLSRKWQSRLLTGGIVLLLLTLPLRHVVLDQSSIATALLLGAFGLAAIALGSVFDLKSAWCSGLCPLHPLELLYGSSPRVTVKNAQCKACSACVAPCRDSFAGVSLLNAGGSRFAAMLLIGGFPGFVLGWFSVKLQPGAPLSQSLLDAYGPPLLGMLCSFAIYVLAVRVRRALATRAFAYAAAAIFYWFKAPELLGLANPGHALVDLHHTFATWSIWVVRFAVVALFAALMLRRRQSRAWSTRPMPERRIP